MFKKLADASKAKRYSAGYHKTAKCKAEPYDPSQKKPAAGAAGAPGAAAGAARAQPAARQSPAKAAAASGGANEKRTDASDGGSYTKAEFVGVYGGTAEWAAAAPRAPAAAVVKAAGGKGKSNVLSRLGGLGGGPAAAAAGPEKRTDANDGGSYTKTEFVEVYGGTAEWDAAAPATKPKPAKPQGGLSAGAAPFAAGGGAGGTPQAFKFGAAKKPSMGDEEAMARAAALAAAPKFGGGGSGSGGMAVRKPRELSPEEAAAKAAALASAPSFGGGGGGGGGGGLSAGAAPFTFGKKKTAAAGGDEASARAAALAAAPRFGGGGGAAATPARVAMPTRRVRAGGPTALGQGGGVSSESGRPAMPAHSSVQALDNVTVGTCCEMCPEEELQYVNGALNMKWSSQPGKVGCVFFFYRFRLFFFYRFMLFLVLKMIDLQGTISCPALRALR